MKLTLATIALCAGLSVSTWAEAEISIVHITKVEQDLYKTSEGQYIETSSCFLEANGERAVLDYVKYRCNNNLQFGLNGSCQVQFVFK
ncbi:MAG TPA: hypothetical protein VIN38_00005 [Thiobacillus sp.]